MVNRQLRYDGQCCGVVVSSEKAVLISCSDLNPVSVVVKMKIELTCNHVKLCSVLVRV